MDTTDHPAPGLTMRWLSRHECWALLREAVIGRLAVVVDGAPDIFPVNFAVDGGSIVVRTSAGTKHRAALAGPVAFEVDGYDVASGEAWSVVGRGRVTEAQAVEEVIDLLDLPLEPWHESRKPHLIRLAPDTLSGRRFPVRGGIRS